MINLEKKEVVNLFIKSCIDWFISWFWPIKKAKDIERINILLDKLLDNSFLIFKDIFKDKEELSKNYFSTISILKEAWKNRYISFIR